MKTMLSRIGRGLLAVTGLALMASACSSEADSLPSVRKEFVFISLTISPARIRNNGSDTAQVTALVEKGADTDRVPSEETPVYFTLLSGGGALSAADAKTDEEGAATVTFAAGTESGIFQIKASLVPPDKQATEETAAMFAVETVTLASGPGAPAYFDNVSAEPLIVEKKKTSTVSASVFDSAGVPVADGTMVEVEIATEGFDDATITSPVVTSAGKINSVFTAGETMGEVAIKMSAIGTEAIYPDPNRGQSPLTITIQPPKTGYINCSLVSPNVLGVRGSSFQEVAAVTFRVFFADGSPAEGTKVDFKIFGPGGGEFLEPLTGTVSGGTVSTQLHSGNVPGPVSVQAVVPSNVEGEPDVTAECMGISIGGGVPNARNFTLAVSQSNIEGLMCVTSPSSPDGTSVASAAYQDVFGHRIPLDSAGQGRAVTFFIEAGGIERHALGNSDGFASAVISTQAPAPQDTTVSLSQHAEPYLDVNDNDRWDGGEPWEDWDLSGNFSEHPCFKDLNADAVQNLETEPFAYCQKMNPNPNVTIPEGYILPSYFLNQDDGVVNYIAVMKGQEGFEDTNGNGLWEDGEPFDDLGEPYIDSNGDGIYNGVRNDPRTNTCADETGKPYADCNPEDYNEPYSDSNDSGHYEVGIDPFKDLNGNGIRDVSEYFEDNRTLAGNKPGVYDLRNGRFDMDTLIYRYGPSLDPASNRSKLGPGSDILFSGAPLRSDIQRLQTLCLDDDGNTIEEYVEGECALGSPWLDHWIPAANFRVPANTTMAFRAMAMDESFNSLLDDATIEVKLEGEGDLYGGASDKLGGSSWRYFTISAPFVDSADTKFCESGYKGARIESKIVEKVVCIGEVRAGDVVNGYVGGLPDHIRALYCSGAGGGDNGGGGQGNGSVCEPACAGGLICQQSACVDPATSTSCENRCCPGRDDACTPPNAACYCDEFCVTVGDCCADAVDMCGF